VGTTNDVVIATSGAVGIGTATPAGKLDIRGGSLFLGTIKVGSTQAAAGATASEVWKTSGHASLPDNVLLIGI
ncbi:MAG: hypothetical protein AAB465_01080, partial [Patescibacteria group bacterium]